MVKWSEVTWYSKLGAITLFLGAIPVLCFYVGMRYQEVLDLNNSPMEVIKSNIQTTKSSSDWKTYGSIEYGFQLQIPKSWFARSFSISGPWELQSTDFSNNLEGVGVPKSGGVWLGISKGCIDGTTADFVHEGNVSVRIFCKSGFEIDASVWNNDYEIAKHIELLKLIANSFQVF